MSVQFMRVRQDESDSIVVFVEGEAPQVAGDSHPNFDAIVKAAEDGDPSVIELFDIAATAAQKFQRLSERVTTANGRLYLDGEEIDNALTTQVLRFLDAGVDDWEPLVKFFENVQANPNEHSREHLYRWLDARDFTITPDGLIVGYKGVSVNADGDFVSIHSGKAIVDGEVKSGQIPNRIGSVIEMPRGQVQFDPGVGCSVGLHVGTYDYASGFGRGGLLEVHVNPRDVVSVPTDSGDAKMRVCRYVVVNTLDRPYSSPVLYDYEDDYDGWGEYEDEYPEW
jgi:hypothetical protein